MYYVGFPCISAWKNAHLENVDVDVGQGEHGPAHHHAQQGAEGRLEAGDVEQQPVLGVEAQRDVHHGPEGIEHTVVPQLACRGK